MRRRARIVLVAFATICLGVVGLAGCGYQDENPQAVRVVAQAYLVAYVTRDPSTICRVVIPPLAATFASEAGGSCEQHIRSTFTHNEPAVRLGAITMFETHAMVYVMDDPRRFIGLIKFGSIWRVTESWLLR